MVSFCDQFCILCQFPVTESTRFLFVLFQGFRSVRSQPTSNHWEPYGKGGRISRTPPCCGLLSLCFCEVVIPSPSTFDSSVHGDVIVDSIDLPSLVRIRLNTLKRDPFRKGVFGDCRGSLCPVAAILYYIIRWGLVNSFTFANGSFLTRDRFVQAVRDAHSGAGFGLRWTQISYRGRNHGIPDSTIKMLGRWESSAYMLDIRTLRETPASISKVLVADVACCLLLIIWLSYCPVCDSIEGHECQY